MIESKLPKVIMKEIVESLHRDGCKTLSTSIEKMDKNITLYSVELSNDSAVSFTTLQNLHLLSDHFLSAEVDCPNGKMHVTVTRHRLTKWELR